MLKDKVLVVTGAGSGLGRATAIAMADAGASVVCNDLGAGSHGTESTPGPVKETVDEIEAAGGTAIASFGDVTDEAYVDDLVGETVSEFGRADGVVNYAGFLRDSMTFNMDRDDWNAVVDVHLTGHFTLLKAFGAHWRQRYKDNDLDGQRSFLSVSSASALGNPGQVNYSAAKAGVLGLTRTGARDLFQYDVRVNAMMPAAVTPGLKANLTDAVLDSFPGDAATPADVAPLPVVLMSDHANDITGWTFAIADDTVWTVTDPILDRLGTSDGGWSPEKLADRIESLIGDRPREKTDANGLLGEVFDL